MVGQEASIGRECVLWGEEGREKLERKKVEAGRVESASIWALVFGMDAEQLCWTDCSFDTIGIKVEVWRHHNVLGNMLIIEFEIDRKFGVSNFKELLMEISSR